VSKPEQYQRVRQRIRALIAGETDEIAVMATVVCELHQGLDYFDWTGFYRVVKPGWLKVGPYQGGHGCLAISFDRGVCGRCARERKTQIARDVTQAPEHIACSSSTRSEIVVPVLDAAGRVRAVLDVDSDRLAAFDEIDALHLEEISRWVGSIYRD
jgi:L-methionine (R)-S-oxide reductase